MSTSNASQYEHDIAPAKFAPLVLQTPGFDRFFAVVKTLVLGGLITWVGLAVLLQVTAPKLRWRARNRVAFWLAVPTAIALATRRFAGQYYLIEWTGGDIALKNIWGTTRIDPKRMQGIVGAGGVNFNFSEAIVWRSLILLAEGRRYALTFEPAKNHICYWRLREICPHAWGIPFQGVLEAPRAGPELDTEEYVEALGRVRSFYLIYTQKSLITGLLMMAGGIVVALAIFVNLQGGGPRNLGRIIFWMLIIAFVGLLLTIRTLRQLPVLFSLRNVERRLREAL